MGTAFPQPCNEKRHRKLSPLLFGQGLRRWWRRPGRVDALAQEAELHLATAVPRSCFS
jgi:hypothetical protein